MVTLFEDLQEGLRQAIDYAKGGGVAKVSSSHSIENPFVPLSSDGILSDLKESREQISEGKGIN